MKNKFCGIRMNVTKYDITFATPPPCLHHWCGDKLTSFAYFFFGLRYRKRNFLYNLYTYNHWLTRDSLELKPKRSLCCLLVVVSLQIKEQLIAEKMNGGLRKKPPAAKEFDLSTWPFFRFCYKNNAF